LASIDASPPGIFILQSIENKLVIAAIYTQIIDGVGAIETVASVEECSLISSKVGKVLQLIRVNTLVKSAAFSTGAGVAGGALLRDFCLEYAAQLGLSEVCAVTRCTEFVETRDISLENYAFSRHTFGHQSDKGLSFHLQRGAQVLKLIPSWRPNDVRNMGYGILVQYSSAEVRPLI
jgi:hypothetical protein